MNNLKEEQYTFFWGGPFSNFAHSPFKVEVPEKGSGIFIEFANNEQYFMIKKAYIFDDKEIGAKILTETNPSEAKKLGREVKGFRNEIWDLVKEDCMYEGLLLKFKQNPDLLEELKKTGTTTIVEASPHDSIWGIGYNEKDALANRSTWGQNLLGKLLMKVREELCK